MIPSTAVSAAQPIPNLLDLTFSLSNVMGGGTLDHSDSSMDSDVISHVNRQNAGNNNADKPKHFYRFSLWPFINYYKVKFDRLALLALLDR